MQIYFFTRSGRSEAIAKQLAARYQVAAERIEDHKNWQGKLNYIKAGYLAARGKALPAEYKKPLADEPIVLVCPLWAGGLPPAVKSFVAEVGRARITCVVTSLGSTLKDRAGFAKVIDLVGDSITAPEELT